MHATPHEGGCWYCCQKDESLVFCCEFDAYVHVACVEEALKEDPDDREARIIAKEVREP